MKQRLRSKVWWPGIDKQAERVCQECFGCQLVSVPTKPEPMIRTELPNAPWEHLACDVLGPLPSGDYLFVVIDYYSQFFELEFTKSITAERIVSLLSKILVTHGLPMSIRTDNGPQFINECFKNFVEENGVEHRRTTPLWPQANGEIERQNRSILKRLRIAQAEGKNLKSEVVRFLMMYSSTPHSITGVAPAELLYGRTYRTKLPQLREIVVDSEVRYRDAERKRKGKIYADNKRNAVESTIQTGDKVLMRQEKKNKLSTTFKSEPFTVIQKNGNQIVIRADSGVQYKRNVTHVKKLMEQEPMVKQDELEQELSVPINDSQMVDGEMDGDREIMPEQGIIRRSMRTKTLPAKFADYVMS